MTVTWEVIGSGLAALSFMVGGFLTFRQKFASANARPAPAPPPVYSPQLDAFAAAVREIEDGRRELRDTLQRNQAMTADDTRDILRTLDQVVNALARIEASQRVTEIMMHAGKHGS